MRGMGRGIAKAHRIRQALSACRGDVGARIGQIAQQEGTTPGYVRDVARRAGIVLGNGGGGARNSASASSPLHATLSLTLLASPMNGDPAPALRVDATPEVLAIIEEMHASDPPSVEGGDDATDTDTPEAWLRVGALILQSDEARDSYADFCVETVGDWMQDRDWMHDRAKVTDGREEIDWTAEQASNDVLEGCWWAVSLSTAEMKAISDRLAPQFCSGGRCHEALREQVDEVSNSLKWEMYDDPSLAYDI